MLLKKLAAVLTSAAIMLSAMPMLSFNSYAADNETVELFCDDFENGDTCGWASHGGAATISISTDQAYSGESSMYITDREQNWQGAECSKVGYLYPGYTYTISLAFYYDDESAGDSQSFELGFKYTKDGSTGYGSIGSVNVTKGEWGVVTATKTFDSNITGIILYTQCSNTTLPYYIDYCTAIGQVYEGETQDGFSYDFEDGTVSDWFGRDCDIQVSTTYAHSGTYSLYTSGRTDLWNSPAVDCNLYCQKGAYYSFSCWALYDGDSWSDTASFQIYLMYNQNGTTQYKNLADESTAKGEWVQISTRYTIPEDATNVAFYIQPKWSSNPSDQDLTIDFYIDDVVCEHLPDPTIQTDIPNLKDAYQDYFIIGCAATASELAVGATQDMILKHYESLTFGNELKPQSTLNQNACQSLGSETEVAISLNQAEPLLQFAADNNIPVRGHCLVWHSQTPEWFFKVGYDENNDWVSRDVMLARMENYIKAVLTTLETEWPDVEIYCWDVVNEAFADNGNLRTAGSINDSDQYSMWMQTIGEDFIEYAFRYAREYAPEGCKLFYNDYNEYTPEKRDAIIEKVAELAELGLIDGIGMQSHLQMSSPSIALYEEAIRKYSELGLEVQITELDVNIKDNSNAAQLELAERYRQVMECIKKCKDDGCNITAVVFWGITDSTSWIGGYPLLFDEDYNAKPSFYAVYDTDAEIQQIRNKNAVAYDEATISLEDAFKVQSSENIGDVGSFKAAWYDSIATFRVTAVVSGTISIYYDDELITDTISAGQTKDYQIAAWSNKSGYCSSFDIVINDTAWNTLKYAEEGFTENTCGTLTFVDFPAYTQAVFGTVEVDGVIDDAWSDAVSVDVNQFQLGGIASNNAYGTAKAMWDNNYIYILVEVTDPNGTYRSGANHYEQDTVEIFFDENNNKTTAYQSDDMQCRIGYDNSQTISDNRNLGDYISAATITSAGYVVEVAIPYSIDVYSSGQIVGYDVQINDDNGSGARAGICNWSGDMTGMGYASTECYGVLELTGGIIYGDVNNDGRVNALDATLVARYAVGAVSLSSGQLANADVNLDGKVNALDATLIARFAVGAIPSLPQ